MEVDLVLSTSEVWNMLKKLASESLPSTTGGNGSKEVGPADLLSTVPPDAPHGCDEMESRFRCFSEDGAKLAVAVENNRGSGGYLEYVYRYATDLLAAE